MARKPALAADGGTIGRRDHLPRARGKPLQSR
jgi:hypothetical protein